MLHAVKRIMSSSKEERNLANVVVNRDNCKACNYCIDRCANHVFAKSDRINAGGYFPVCVASPEKCSGCLKCYFICPDFAIGVEKNEQQPE